MRRHDQYGERSVPDALPPGAARMACDEIIAQALRPGFMKDLP